MGKSYGSETFHSTFPSVTRKADSILYIDISSNVSASRTIICRSYTDGCQFEYLSYCPEQAATGTDTVHANTHRETQLAPQARANLNAVPTQRKGTTMKLGSEEDGTLVM